MSDLAAKIGNQPQLSVGAILQLLQRIARTLAQESELTEILNRSVRILGEVLEVDRCTILLLSAQTEDDDERNLCVAAEYAASNLVPVGNRQYQVNANSELFRLLLEGRPLPLKDIMPADSSPQSSELDSFSRDSDSKSVVCFPMVVSQKLVGCLCLHYCRDGLVFPEQILEVGEVVTQQLAQVVDHSRSWHDRELEGRVFRDLAVAALIVDKANFRVMQANSAANRMLAGARKQLQGLPLLHVMPDGQRLINEARELSKSQPTVMIPGLLVGSGDGHPMHMDVCLSLLHDEQGSFLVLLTSGARAQPGEVSESAMSARLQRAEELTNNLSRQISWERWVRQIICKLHATLDRDTLLQTVVDGFGRALGASRCLVVRTDGPATPMVTHEYAEPDTSPLGLGRTGQFPAAAVSYFKHKVAAVPDLVALGRSGELTAEEYEYFLDNGVRSMAGAPLSSHGINYGVIIILESGSGRTWSPHELDMLEIAANQTAVALGHSQAYLQLKDQLFNMNLLGNLTQQLTNTLELVSRAGKPEGPEEKNRQSGSSPPLSLRELEVLKLIAAGLANREIAQRLFLTESTVELHASRIRKKLKLKSRTALVKYACDNGLA